MLNISDLPCLNASLNGVASVLLVGGFVAGKARNVKLHKLFMVAALVVSAAFLTSYLIYHFNTEIVSTYQGEGLLRNVYYTILLTHIPLATLMVPFIFAAVWFAYSNQLPRHRAVVKWLWPVWMYVSVTGVVIYLMLY